MGNFVNGVEFFNEGVINSRSHKRTNFTFSDRFSNFFQENNIYTKPRIPKGQRFKNGETFVVGENSVIEPYTMFLSGKQLHTMGSFSSVNSELPINTIVGRYSSVAHNVKRMYGSHPMDRFTTSMLTYDSNVTAFKEYLLSKGMGEEKSYYVRNSLPNGSPIIIGNDVWVGQDVTFSTSGVSVGDGAIIAAESTITKDVPPYAIVGGSPAKIIKFRFSQNIIHKLMNLQWWQYEYGDFKGVRPDDDIETFINKIQKLVDSGELKPYHPEYLTINDFVQLH